MKYYQGDVLSWLAWLDLRDIGYEAIDGSFYVNGLDLMRALDQKAWAADAPKHVTGNVRIFCSSGMPARVEEGILDDLDGAWCESIADSTKLHMYL